MWRFTALLVGASISPAHAEDPLPVFAESAATLNPIAAYFAALPQIKQAAIESQPSWVSPVATTTARLEQNLRYEQSEQVTTQGAVTNNYDNSKGVRIIVAPNVEIQANPPPLENRTVTKPGTGTGDWQFTSVRYRLLSANAADGDYVVTAYSNFQAPTGSTPFTSHAWIYTPSLAAGKGFGAFDVQANVSLQVPGSHRSTIGDALVGNVAFQYHLWEYLWPELEFNATHYIGGQRTGLTQVFITPGILFGRFALTKDNNLTFGIGYQTAIVPAVPITSPALTPTYSHSLILATRLSF